MLFMDNWSPCPRCGSNRVQKISKWAMVMSLFGAGGCLLWIGIFFPPLWLLVPIILIASFVMMFGKSTWQCQDCKKTWIAKKSPPGP